MHTPPPADHFIADELSLLGRLVPLGGQSIIELGCGKAELARRLVAAHPGSQVLGLEVDERQLARNLAQPDGSWPGIRFEHAGAEQIPAPEASFDLALMLKSLHHVPLDRLDQALGEVWRVLRPGGCLYVSEPVYDGALNHVMLPFNDEGTVRRAAYLALLRALRSGAWEQVTERYFEAAVRYASFAEFEQRMIQVTFAERRVDAAMLAEVRARFELHAAPDGSAAFTRPMRINLLRKCG